MRRSGAWPASAAASSAVIRTSRPERFAMRMKGRSLGCGTTSRPSGCRIGQGQHLPKHAAQLSGRVIGQLSGPPGGVPSRRLEEAAAVADAADPPPVTADVVIELAVADRTRRQPDTEIGSGLLGGTDPWLATDSHDERQLLGRADVQGGHRVGAGLQPHMGQPAARPRARRVIEFLITCRGRRGAPVRDNRVGAVALAELDAVSVELVVLQLDGALQLLTTGGAGGPGLGELVQTRPALVHALGGPEPASGLAPEHLGDALHRAVDDLLADRLALLGVAVEQVVAG